MKKNRQLKDHLFNPAEIEEIVIWTRYYLYNYGFLYGAKAIRSCLSKEGLEPLPSLSTIGRILKKNGLTYRRTGNYD